MAATQKKGTATSTKKTITTRSKSGTSSKTGTTKSRASGGKGGGAPRPIRREVGGGICLFLAIFSIFGLFGVKAPFIDFFCSGIKGLFGYGFWLAPIILLLASYILFFHRGRPVRLRLVCALLLLVLTGAVLQLFLHKEGYVLELSIVKKLWQDGMSMKSGGVVSGLLGQVVGQFFGALGAKVMFILGALFAALAAFNRTVMDVVEGVRNRPHPEYEEKPKPERREKAVSKVLPTTHSKAVIDIPVDEPPVATKTPELPVEKKGFFNRKSSVQRPDQVLVAGMPEEPATKPIAQPVAEQPKLDVVTTPWLPPESAPAPAPVVPPVPQPEPKHEPVTVFPEIVREPAVEKVKPEESAQAAVEVAEDIAKRMDEGVSAYQYPPVSLLVEGDGVVGSEALGELKNNQNRLSDTIRSFGIDAHITDVTRGPSVTRYEVELDQGVRLNKLTNLADDIALALGATGVRIAPIPDKISMVGIEVPNKLVSPVFIHDVIDSKNFRDNSSKVSFAVGKDIGGNAIVGNIAKLPHLLIAGTTGSGKSVCTNALIISMLYKSTPDEVRLIMIDPKMVELGIYNGIPHLLIPVVTDPKKAAGALQWAVTEMMKRYRSFAEVGVRDLASYNAMAVKTEGMKKMPQVVVVIDELADLMLVAAKEVEESICRVAQMGRASGMHLIIATQRPSADVITGLMKANIPSRIAFAVASALESRIILDTQGAEKLVGRGDMLYFPLGSGKPVRVQGCLISDQEVNAVVEFVKGSGKTDYDESIIHEIEQHAVEKEKGSKGNGGGAAVDGVDTSFDELLPNAIEVVVDTGMASVSMLQRRLKLGYSRAARLVDQMEEKGIVGPFEGSKPRQVLITKDQWQEMQFRQNMTEDAPPPPPAMVEVDDEPPFELDEIEE